MSSGAIQMESFVISCEYSPTKRGWDCVFSASVIFYSEFQLTPY